MTESKEKTSTSTDSAWKDILDHYFKDFLQFFFPKVYQKIDWRKKYEWADKELQQVVRDAEFGRRYVDKLAKVWFKGGRQTFVYVHVEIQGQEEKNLPQRVFVYHYRLYDRGGQPLISLVILADNKKGWAPNQYSYDLAGCQLSFQFPVVKLLDYLEKWEELEQSDNPFAMVVRMHLTALKTRRSPKKRLQWKQELCKELYNEQKFSPQDFYELWRFLDWVMTLPEALTQQFDEFIEQYEEVKQMPYITTVERKGIERGRQEGIQLGIRQTLCQNVIDILQTRFKRIPKTLLNQIQALEDTAQLSKLLREAVSSSTLQMFAQRLKEVT